jgi:hypothetical protein
MTPVGFRDRVASVWNVADKLRGTFKQHDYDSVVLPLLVHHRIDDASRRRNRCPPRSQGVPHDRWQPLEREVRTFEGSSDF